MSKTRRKETERLSERLRQFIATAGVSRYRISKDTGLDQGLLSHFVHGRRRLSQDAIDTLAEYLGLELVKRR
jgi:transcriptional regulator with XRE-family HTH domain